MKKTLFFFLLSGLLLTLTPSCVDTSYDDYDTSGEFDMGAFPIGNIDTLDMSSFSDDLDFEFTMPDNAKYSISDTLDIFNEDIVEQFFYPGGNVSIIVDTVKADFGAGNEGMKASIYFQVLKSNKTNTGIAPKVFEINNGATYNQSIDFAGSDMTKMGDAQYLVVTSIFTYNGSPNENNLKNNGYIQLRSVKLAGKVHFE